MAGPLDLSAATCNGNSTLAFTVSPNTNLPALALNTLSVAATAAQPLLLNVTVAAGFTPALGFHWTFLTTTSGIAGLTDLSAIQAPSNWFVSLGNGGNSLALVYGNLGGVKAGAQSDLNGAIVVANQISAGQSLTVTLTTNITFDAPLPFIQLPAGAVLAIDGNGYTLNAASNQGLVVLSGNVLLSDLAISNALSYGGDGQAGDFGFGGGGGGGGAGMGGALFIGTNADVVAGGLTLNNNRATGGSGSIGSSLSGYGGGGLFNDAGGYGSSGGFGGGGGGGDFGGSGGSGGYGGGGGGGGGGMESSGAGGAGGFGGSGGASGGIGFEGFSGPGGFGGGGAGLGGAIFVASGGQFVLNGSLAVNGNIVAGGAGAFSSGSAYGSGLFLQGNGTLAFTPGAGQAQRISDNIADETGSGGAPVGDTGQWGLTLNGPGTLVLAGSNTYSGGTLLSAGTLEASSTNALGVGNLVLGSGAALEIVTSNMTGPLDLNVATCNGNSTLAFTAGPNTNLPALSLNFLVVAANAAQPLVLNVTPAAGFTPKPGYLWTFLTTAAGIAGLTDLSAIQAPANWFVALVNGGNSLALVYGGAGNLTAGSPSDLNGAIIVANQLSSGQSLTVNVTTNITLSAPPRFIQLSAGVVLAINGNGYTLNAASNQGLVVLSGTVVLTNLVISNALSYGGDGQDAGLDGTGEGGGGAGMGAALFIGTNANVVAGGLTLINNQAAGGSGVADTGSDNSGGGGVFNNVSGGFGSGGAGGNGGSAGSGGYGGGGGGGGGGPPYGMPGYGAGGGFGGSPGADGQPSFDNVGFGTEGFGGAGAGLGGAIFVAAGGQFALNGSLAVNGNKVAGGAGASASGSAYGSGFFLQGNGTLTFIPGSGQSQTISDNIADEIGSGGGVGAFGKWGLTLNGPGTLTLAGFNTYTGYTLLSAGTLQASSGNALGSGTLILDAGATLQIDNGSMGRPLDLYSSESTFIGGATLAFTASANTNVPALASDALLLAADAAQPLLLNVTLAAGFTPAPGYQSDLPHDRQRHPGFDRFVRHPRAARLVGAKSQRRQQSCAGLSWAGQSAGPQFIQIHRQRRFATQFHGTRRQ